MIVHKYGGSSVATISQIKEIAEHLKKLYETEKQIVVVVSAMGKTTNNLISTINEISQNPVPRELDSLLSTGEIQSSVLLSSAINEIGVNAVSLTGKQAGIKTSSDFNHAFIKKITSTRILSYLEKNFIVIVAGFQGIANNGDTTTLGRGGSDTTAVALAGSLGCACEIYTDVTSVHRIDPRLTENAKKLSALSYNEMMELAVNGAKIFEPRSVELAKKYNVELHIGKALTNLQTEGTKVMQQNNINEEMCFTGVAVKENINIVKIKTKSENTPELIKCLSNGIFNLEFFNYKNENGISELSVALSNELLNPFIFSLEKIKPKETIVENNLIKITLVGSGIATHKNLITKLFSILLKDKIEITNLILSEISISFTSKQCHKEQIIKLLSENFEL